MSIVFGADPIEDEIVRVLDGLASGRWDGTETATVDLKEEAGRRDGAGRVLPGETQNEPAARKLAGEASCMANTPGGGAIVLGAADNGELIGTSLDVEWLRHRVYQLTENRLTINARPVEVNTVRLLVITAPQAIEPIRWRGRISWRIGDHCVEVDAATWQAKRMIGLNFDWSSQPSHVGVGAAREASVDIARGFLRRTNEGHSLELASLPTPELLRRLNVVTGDGLLINAGVLAFVGRGNPCIDYIRRDSAGGDSRQRVHRGDRGLLEELEEVFTYISAHNTVRHITRGLAAGQLADLPEQAVREAVVNGVAHREWALPQPTTVEHIGTTLCITSPGGFFGGVNATNIITHPSQSRNRALTDLFAAVRIAEREGVGVDRMVREMLRLGHQAPDIDEISGPFVRVSLVADAVDRAWLEWLDHVRPMEMAEDLNALLLLRHLVDEAWVDVSTAMPILQLNRAESLGAIQRLADATLDDDAIIRPVSGTPDDGYPAWALTNAARHMLQELDLTFQRSRPWPSRTGVARSFARLRGRISTTELGGLIGVSPTNVGGVLKQLESEGDLRPSRDNRRGPGFFYRWSDDGAITTR